MAIIHGHSSSSLAVSEIVDSAKLGFFRQKRSEWFELLESGRAEVVTLRKQLMDMIVLDLNYRVFISETSNHAEGEGFAIPSLRYLLNAGYVTCQSLAARRMLDTRDDVASLSRVLKDIKKHRKYITRENFVSYDGTPYDFDLHFGVDNAGLAQEHMIFGLHGPSFSAQLRSFHRHERFDSLSGVHQDARNRTDLIHPSIFATLKLWLESPEAKRLKEISDSRFAHASDGSHAAYRDNSDLALFEVERAQMGFVKTCRAIFDVLLNSGVYADVVPMIPLGAFGKAWTDTGMVPTTSRMQEQWDALATERNRWGLSIDEELFAAALTQDGRVSHP